MAYICFLTRDEEGNMREERRHRLDKDKETTLGRDPAKADVEVPDGKASSLHCKIRFDGANWWVIDLASRNGIKVNRKRCESSPLLDGYIIKIGKTRLKFGGTKDSEKPLSKLGTGDEEDEGPRVCSGPSDP